MPICDSNVGVHLIPDSKTCFQLSGSSIGLLRDSKVNVNHLLSKKMLEFSFNTGEKIAETYFLKKRVDGIKHTNAIRPTGNLRQSNQIHYRREGQ